MDFFWEIFDTNGVLIVSFQAPGPQKFDKLWIEPWLVFKSRNIAAIKGIHDPALAKAWLGLSTTA